jgi:hypothetical protein
MFNFLDNLLQPFQPRPVVRVFYAANRRLRKIGFVTSGMKERGEQQCSPGRLIFSSRDELCHYLFDAQARPIDLGQQWRNA